MTKFVARAVGRAAGRRAVQHAHEKGWFDVRLGYALLKDRRVRPTTKLLCLAIGLVATIALEALEMPIEAIFALVLPIIAPGIALIDGLELLLMPVVIGSVLLTHLAPKDVVEAVRQGV